MIYAQLIIQLVIASPAKPGEPAYRQAGQSRTRLPRLLPEPRNNVVNTTVCKSSYLYEN
jgi:hypothetical protein